MASSSVPSFSSATYTPVPTTPTRSQRTHSTTVAVYSDEKDSPSPPSTPPRRLSTFPLSSLPSSRSSRRLPTLIAVGSLVVLAWTLLGRSSSSSSALYAPAGRLQYNSRGKVAVDFEAHDVPEEWKCNPYKEPGRLFVDLKKPVGLSPLHPRRRLGGSSPSSSPFVSHRKQTSGSHMRRSVRPRS